MQRGLLELTSISIFCCQASVSLWVCRNISAKKIRSLPRPPPPTLQETFHLAGQVTIQTFFPTQNRALSFSFSLDREALYLTFVYHRTFVHDNMSRGQLSFSWSDPLFSFSFGEQWVQSPDPRREMGLPALPWKPWPCSSNQHVRTGKLFHWLTEWTKNKTAHHQSLLCRQPLCLLVIIKSHMSTCLRIFEINTPKW